MPVLSPDAPGVRRRCALARLCGVALAALPLAAAAADDPAAAVQLQNVEVIGTTPLPGLGLPLRDVPANVQVFGARDIARQHAGNLSRFLEDNPASVTVNAAQGNPYQTDISFRGFTASPLLGVPQGLSVFQDGVRINEPFGDVVNWDLLPQSAIASLQLIPGSNPLFGLNTLGGALAVYTKSGATHPGTAVEASGGSFGRKTFEIEQGATAGPWDWFGTANLSREDGWAQHNPSRIAQVFAKLGYQSGTTALDLSLTSADNHLEGSQTLPRSFLDDRRQAYTFPDLGRNRMTMLALEGSRSLAPSVQLGGNAYARRYRNANVSSDVNDDFGQADPATGDVDTVQAFNDRSQVRQDSDGLGVQLTFGAPLAGHPNQAVFGLGGDFGRTGFRQDAQRASFDAARNAVPVDDFEPQTAARLRNRTLSAFVGDTFALTPRWSLTTSGRYNDARVGIRDTSGADPALAGDHRFRRFNPAIGATFNPRADLTAYASYNEGLRAPTAIELTCADPLAPCKLPNSFLADPALAPVIARTLEIGARGRAAGWRWSAAAYRSELANDIQFISSGNAINAGYFRNVGKTRRQGVELLAEGDAGPARLSLRYGLIDAVYAVGFVEHSADNSAADAHGDIAVAAGAHVPGIPRQTWRARVEADPLPRWALGASMLRSSAQRARGDENNQDAAGRIAGYTVFNLDTTWKAAPGMALFARVDNVFDRRYASFGVLGRNVFANAAHRFDPENGVSEPFVGQGAPRGAWGGVRFEWK